MDKYLIIPDSYKGTIDSIDACKVMEDVLKRKFPHASILSYPVADGGEGTVDCFLHALPQGGKIEVDVRGAFGDPIKASYGKFDDVAVIEMAAVVGLSMYDKLNPAEASTFGVGQIILDAIKKNCRTIILGMGGSCTNDGGAGMAAAVGTKFYDSENREFVPTGGNLHKVSKIDNSITEKLVRNIKIRGMCDIDNPMYGKNGATYVFAPQKGADEEMLPVLDKNMRTFAHRILQATGIELKELKGGGAAGAFGAGAYAFLGADLEQGINVILDMINIEEKLDGCNMVFTGEGKLDRQSLGGKVVIGVGERAKKLNVPVTAVVGSIEGDLPDLEEYGISRVYETSKGPLPTFSNKEDLTSYCMTKLSETMETVAENIKKERIVKIPYGSGFMELTNDFDSCEVLCPAGAAKTGSVSQHDIVATSLSHPIESPGLRSLAEGSKTAVIIISDHTRPVPSKLIIPRMLDEMRKGNPDIDITLLAATGFHRGTQKDELIAKLGEKIFNEEKIEVHDCKDESRLKNIGTLPSGAPLIINSLAAETDLLVSEGFIEPHFFAGFSGGRKSVLPGIAGYSTVMGNHCADFISDPNAVAGCLDGNPIHRDMIAAYRLADLKFIVNVLLDENKKIVSAVSGHPEKAHLAGCEELKKYCLVKPERKGDIVITSNGGAPLDQNIYQAVKSMYTAEAAAQKDAVLIVCSECGDGVGSETLYDKMKMCGSAGELLQQIEKIPMEGTEPDQWQYQILAKILTNNKVILVSDRSLEKTIRDIKLDYAPSIEEALKIAYQTHGKSSHHVVIPDGIAVIIDR